MPPLGLPSRIISSCLKESFKITTSSLEREIFIQEISLEAGYSFSVNYSTIIFKDTDAEAFAPFYLVQSGTIAADDLIKTKPDVELWTTPRAEWMVATAGGA
jgi:hypothetical protein